MDYKLALKLKEAGFPQHFETGYHRAYYDEATQKQVFIFKSLGKEIILKPTLDDLIEACGDEFDFLERFDDGKWNAIGINYHDSGLCDSAIEAVAQLWLALNKK